MVNWTKIRYVKSVTQAFLLLRASLPLIVSYVQNFEKKTHCSVPVAHLLQEYMHCSGIIMATEFYRCDSALPASRNRASCNIVYGSTAATEFAQAPQDVRVLIGHAGVNNLGVCSNMFSKLPVHSSTRNVRPCLLSACNDNKHGASISSVG